VVPISIIEKWRQYAPWTDQNQVEHDLVLSRALIELYQNEVVRHSLALRGGTALNKLFAKSFVRYSEDIDLVQTGKGPIGNILSAIRGVLEPWLGKARWDAGPFLSKLIFRFQSENGAPMRLKIEINTAEVLSIYGYQDIKYKVKTNWFSGEALIKTYQLEELIGTKLRALYQRNKGRDLFDIWIGLTELNMDIGRTLNVFYEYNKFNNISISRAEYERNMILKMQSYEFTNDIKTLFPSSLDLDQVYSLVMREVISKLSGNPYKNLNLLK
jgi:predicted nucleotidyltransferase component of viral defense system